MLGEMFPGRKLRDESGEDGDGQTVADPWDIDLDSGVVRLRAVRAPVSKSAPKSQPIPEPKSAAQSAPAPGPDAGRGPGTDA